MKWNEAKTQLFEIIILELKFWLEPSELSSIYDIIRYQVIVRYSIIIRNYQVENNLYSHKFSYDLFEGNLKGSSPLYLQDGQWKTHSCVFLPIFARNYAKTNTNPIYSQNKHSSPSSKHSHLVSDCITLNNSITTANNYSHTPWQILYWANWKQCPCFQHQVIKPRKRPVGTWAREADVSKLISSYQPSLTSVRISRWKNSITMFAISFIK